MKGRINKREMDIYKESGLYSRCSSGVTLKFVRQEIRAVSLFQDLPLKWGELQAGNDNVIACISVYHSSYRS